MPGKFKLKSFKAELRTTITIIGALPFSYSIRLKFITHKKGVCSRDYEIFNAFLENIGVGCDASEKISLWNFMNIKYPYILFTQTLRELLLGLLLKSFLYWQFDTSTIWFFFLLCNIHWCEFFWHSSWELFQQPFEKVFNRWLVHSYGNLTIRQAGQTPIKIVLVFGV